MKYATFFSGAGIGCHGFIQNGFECVLTNEYLPERIEIQKINDKCSTSDQYVVGDVRDSLVRKRIENLLREAGNLDVLVATPPCQGISLANHKKTPTEIVRNSLILESILLTKKFKPKYFVYENVLKFLTSACSDSDGFDREVSEVIDRHLKTHYSIERFVFNLKNFSIPSSRTRTVVVGVRKDLEIHPLSVFPEPDKIITLQKAIGHLKPLNYPGEYDENDVLHFFRPYDERMLPWIENIAQGQSAFDQDDQSRVPNQVINGVVVRNAAKNGDKYKRQRWDEVGPCIHTRSDTFSSQNTIHPEDNRVFSLRELMLMMTIPKTFRWWDKKIKIKTYEELKRYELNIRKAIGESFPTRYLELLSANILKKHSVKLTEAEALNCFVKTLQGNNITVTDADQTITSKEITSLLKKSLFYNRIGKANGNRICIHVGGEGNFGSADYVITKKSIPGKLSIATFRNYKLFRMQECGNLTLF